MTARIVLIALFVLGLLAPAFAQNPKAPVKENCIDGDGHAVACQLSDVPWHGDIIAVPRGLLPGFAKGEGIVYLNGTQTSYPARAVPVTGVGTGTTGTVTATLAATPGVTNYLCTFDVSATGTGAVGSISVNNLAGGADLAYQLAAPGVLQRSFSPCIPASGPNITISVVTTGDPSATAVAVNLIGFQQ